MQRLPLFACALIAVSACVGTEQEPLSPSTQQPLQTDIAGQAIVLTMPWNPRNAIVRDVQVGVYNASTVLAGRANVAAPIATATLPFASQPCAMGACGYRLQVTLNEPAPHGLLTDVRDPSRSSAWATAFTAAISPDSLASSAGALIENTPAFVLPQGALEKIATALVSNAATLQRQGLLIGIVTGPPAQARSSNAGLPPFLQGATVTIANQVNWSVRYPDDNVTTWNISQPVTNKNGYFFATGNAVAGQVPTTLHLQIRASGHRFSNYSVPVAPNTIVISVFYADA